MNKSLLVSTRAPEIDLDRLVEAARWHLCATDGVPDRQVRCVISPYRICPLGAHSDHQGGTVLGMAISAYSVLAFAPADDGMVTITSPSMVGRESTVRFPVDRPGDGKVGDWGSYARGSAWSVADLLPASPRGITASVFGSLPGAGLSSSASVDLAYITALCTVNEIELDEQELPRRALQVETGYLGLRCGLLDPVSIAAARRGHLLSIDCLNESWQPLGLGAGATPHRLLIAFSGSNRQLTATGFNDRVAECRRAARQIARRSGRARVEILGQLPLEVIEAHLEQLPEGEGRRARHFVSEARRVEAGAAAWQQGDIERVGELMQDSCQSSIRNYECGSPEVIALQQVLEGCRGVIGSRFSGGGYGGCCVALVEEARAEEVMAEAEESYRARQPAAAARARFFLVKSEDGVRLA